MRMIKYCLAVLMAAGLWAAQTQALTQEQQDAIAERLQPTGEVCLKGEPCAASAGAAASGPRSGEEVYNASCMACHDTGAAGAPKLGDAAGWADRIAQGTDTLYANALNGIRGMPARGTCGNCSDEEIEAAVDYMVDNSQ